MKTKHRRAARSKRDLLAANPVARAVRIHQVDTEYKDQTMVSRVDMFMRADGVDATDLLAAVAVVVGSVCQLAAALDMYDTHPQVRMLHGALRTIQQMCLDGYAWHRAYAPALCNALDVADALSRTLTATAEQVSQAAQDAEWFASQITARTVTATSVLDSASNREAMGVVA